MLLQEEYLKRHGLTVPIVNHTIRDGCLLIRNKKPEMYAPSRYILDIRWMDEGNHPGNYHITSYKNSSDGMRRENFIRLTDPIVVSYDEYENYLERWVENQRIHSTSVSTYESSVMFMWELFISTFDSWLAKTASPVALQKVEITLDDDLDLIKKMRLIEDAIATIGSDHSQIISSWEHNFLPYARKNFYWLARMLNGE